MSNVLGNLFGEIANAIRAKTGGTDTMKPAEFSAEIAAIPTGGGSSGGELKYVEKSFTASSTMETISHNLGCIPDITIVTFGGIPVGGTVILGVGFSSAMLVTLGGGWLNKVQCASASGGAVSLSSNIGVEAADHSSYSTFGGIRSMTDTSFVVGSTSGNGGLYAGEVYTWIAISGITG